MTCPHNSNEEPEVDYLLETIFTSYGHDFRNYSRASIERRIRQFLSKSRCGSASELAERIREDEELFTELLQTFSITVTEMFRDPLVYASLREQVIPLLNTRPNIKIWHAGCATGEEAYSLAILLREEGLDDRASIFATDFNDHALQQAKQGIYPTKKAKDFSSNYMMAGGVGSLSEYYYADGDRMILDRSLRKNMTFANHNLAIDNVFGEMDLILCRNVLIYFNLELQKRVYRLFEDSLSRGGFLCLGMAETPTFAATAGCFEPVVLDAKIYRKTT